MTELLIGLLSAGAGALLTWFLMRQQAQQQLSEAALNAQQNQQALLNEKQTLEQRLQVETAQQAMLKESNEQLQQSLAARQQELVTVEKQLTALDTELNTLKTAQAKWQEQLETQWKQQLESFIVNNWKEVKTLAESEYEEKQKLLDSKLQTLLKPLNERLSEYQDNVHKLDKTHHASTELIQAELKRLGKINQKLEATLSFNKGRGNWGELELLRLLEDSGLVEGVGYEKQPAYQGGKKRPDVRICLPEGRSVFIDAKALQVDITEEAELANDVSEESFNARCKRQLDSLKQAVKQLASKDYQMELPDSADFVILYVPRESMLSLAYYADASVVQWAYQQKVILATPLQLMAMLRIVHHSWKMAKLSDDARDILDLGTKLYSQAAVFSAKFDKLSKSVHALNKAYQEAYTSLDGQTGMMKRLRKLADYGCDAGKSLPDDLYVPDTLPMTSDASS